MRVPDGAVATTVEGVSLSVDLSSRRVAAFPTDVAARLGEAVTRGAAETPRLDWLGRRVAMSRE